MGYLSTRFSSLVPKRSKQDTDLTIFQALKSMKFQQWVFFSVGFFAWCLDALDFHAATQTYADLAVTLGVSTEDISWGVTLILMLRFVGGIIFGTAADIFGRKWPLVCNLFLIIILEILTGFCATLRQFLAVRALFGVAMGGIYGNAAATALEDCPEEALGLLSGIYQTGYNVGYLLAVLFWKAFSGTKYGWRSLFWLSAGLPVLLIIVRICLPETKTYQGRTDTRDENDKISRIVAEAKIAVRRHWLLLLYLVLLLTGFSYMSHGSQDVYALMLQYKYNYSNSEVTLVQVVACLGAILGGITMGHLSQILGRRLCIIAMCLGGAAMIYPYTFVSNSGIYAAAFLEQFCVQGAFGVIPIHLLELSPTPFRTFFVGTSYQMGVLIASASNTIETHIGERYPLPPQLENGQSVQIYDYSLVICIFMSCTFVYVIIATILGPEKRGRLMKIVMPEPEDGGDWNTEIDPRRR